MVRRADLGSYSSRPEALQGEARLAWSIDFMRSAPGFWYVATPYTHYPFGLAAAWRHAAQVASILTAHRLAVYSPIAHHCEPTTLAPTLDLSLQAFWMAITAPVRRAACGLIVVELAGWDASDGVSDERKEFYREGKPVYHLNRVVLRELVAGLRPGQSK